MALLRSYPLKAKVAEQSISRFLSFGAVVSASRNPALDCLEGKSNGGLVRDTRLFDVKVKQQKRPNLGDRKHFRDVGVPCGGSLSEFRQRAGSYADKTQRQMNTINLKGPSIGRGR